jgi:hypothetical protein
VPQVKNNGLECAYDQFPTYHTNILLADFIAKVGRDAFNSIIENKNVHVIRKTISGRLGQKFGSGIFKHTGPPSVT